MAETVTVRTKDCLLCGKGGTVDVDKAELERWQAGEFIQVAMPSASADVREQLITGTHGPCFDAAFPEED